MGAYQMVCRHRRLRGEWEQEKDNFRHRAARRCDQTETRRLEAKLAESEHYSPKERVEIHRAAYEHDKRSHHRRLAGSPDAATSNVGRPTGRRRAERFTR